MRILEEPSTFIRRHFVESGKRKSPLTWRAAAYQLKIWLEFLMAQDIAWDIAAADDLVRYRDALFHATSPRSMKRYDEKTIRNYLLTVISFYRFSADNGWYRGSLCHDEKVEERLRSTDGDALAHIRKGVKYVKKSALDTLVPRGNRNHNVIRPFSVNDWRALAKALGPYPSERVPNDPRSSRNRLLCEVAFWTGLRVAEVCGLAAKQFETIDLNGLPQAGYSRLYLSAETTKGQVKGVIRIPNWLVSEIQLYIRTERRNQLELRSRKNETRPSHWRRTPEALFLTSRDSNRPGEPLGKRQIQAILSKACHDAGLTRIEQSIEPSTGRIEWREVAAHSFHDLRHSFAIWTYWIEKKRGNPEPWKLIQAQLRHKALATTVDTYLHYAEIFDDTAAGIDVRKLMGL